MPNPFHAGYKLAWLEQVANDRRASDFHVRVSIAVSRRADRSGIATAGQEGLAAFIGATSRGVRNALRDLGKFNHLQRESDGAGGRGVVGRYRLVLTVDGLGGESRNDAARNVRVASSHSGKHQDVIPESVDIKPGIVVPSLPYSSINFLNEHSDAADLCSDWEAVLEGARARFGTDVVTSWFSPLKIARFSEGVGIIVAPNRFIADHVSAQYGDHIQQWWSQVRANVRLVRFIVRA